MGAPRGRTPDPEVVGAPCPGDGVEATAQAAAAAACADDAAIAAALQAEEDARAAEGEAARERQLGGGPGGGGAGNSPMYGGDGALPLHPAAGCKTLVRRSICGVLFVIMLAVVGYILTANFLGSQPWRDKGEYDLGDFQEISRAAFTGTNEYRASKGLPALRWNDGIAEIAAEHAAQMASGEARFSHEGFGKRAAKFPVMYSRAGENLAACPGTAEGIAACAVNGWVESPLHEENLVGDWELCGIGTARSTSESKFFLTQLFAATLKSGVL